MIITALIPVFWTEAPRVCWVCRYSVNRNTIGLMEVQCCTGSGITFGIATKNVVIQSAILVCYITSWSKRHHPYSTSDWFFNIQLFPGNTKLPWLNWSQCLEQPGISGGGPPWRWWLQGQSSNSQPRQQWSQEPGGEGLWSGESWHG